MSTELQALLDRRCLSSWHMAPGLAARLARPAASGRLQKSRGHQVTDAGLRDSDNRISR